VSAKRSFLASSLRKCSRRAQACCATARDGASMGMQQETDVHDHLSNEPSIVGSKHDSAMQCANPRCSKELLYLREGTLNLLEMGSHSDNQFQSDVGAFAMRSVPSRYFWLCGECSKTLIVKRWTTAGIVLVLRNPKTAGSHPNLAARPATPATTRPLPAPLTVPRMPPKGHPLHRPALLVLRRDLLGPRQADPEDLL
jgi:hypothetical protein